MSERRDSEIHMIPLDQITIVNPRDRGRRMFKTRVDVQWCKLYQHLQQGAIS